MVFPIEETTYRCPYRNCGLVYGSRKEAQVHCDIQMDMPLPSLLVFRPEHGHGFGRRTPPEKYTHMAFVVNNRGLVGETHSFSHRVYDFYYTPDLKEKYDWCGDYNLDSKKLKDGLKEGRILLLDEVEFATAPNVLRRVCASLRNGAGFLEADIILMEIEKGNALVRTTPELDRLLGVA